MQKLFLIDKLNILKINTKGNSFYPIGYYKKNVCYLENIENVWKPVGFAFRDIHYNIEYFSLKHKILITREYGLQKIFNLNFKKLFSFYGSLHLHPCIHRSDLVKFFINFTDSGIQELSYTTHIIKRDCVTPYCKLINAVLRSERIGSNSSKVKLLFIPISTFLLFQEMPHIFC
jgi:hypothetical protein